MHEMWEWRSGARRAPIKDRIMMLSTDAVNDCSPIKVRDQEEYITGVILTQYSMKAGLAKFGQ